MPWPPTVSSLAKAARACSAAAETPIARRIVLHGRVQGLGVRPAIARLAESLDIGGHVCNSSCGVEVVVGGASRHVQTFMEQLAECLPGGVEVERMLVEPTAPLENAKFTILASLTEGDRSARVPPDVAVCEKCLLEVAAHDNRRAGYPFTTCTACGPRYSLIDDMPYDRRATAMSGFQQCAACQREYRDSGDRRFHSQTNGCPECGPRIWLDDSSGRRSANTDAVIEAAIESLRCGQVVAVRGIGGYQLLADARSPAAIELLRRRKQRPGKPLAVLVADLTAVKRLAPLTAEERQALASPANPIVLVGAARSSPLAPAVTGGLHRVGLMLPTSPLHEQLVRRFGGPLVATSGNREGDPLIYDQDAPSNCFAGLADCSIHHDRPIRRPIDDSVVQVIAGRAATIRLARGLAPLPLELRCGTPMVALGGHQKAALALSSGAQCVLGPHIGDLESEATRVRYVEQFDSLCQLYDTRPEVLVHDEHPDYFTTRWAAEQGLRTMGVEHHHAHVAAGMLEHGWLDRTVLGVAWDGTGYGADGAIWGGEFLLATGLDYRRVGCLRPFELPGGASAIREPWRVAAALVWQSHGAERAASFALSGVSRREHDFVVRSLATPGRWPATTSAGRLFDAAAALVLGTTRCDFEGQAAMLLEAACDESAGGEYELPISNDTPAQLDWRPVLAGLLDDLQCGVPQGVIAMRFHRSLAGGIAAVVEQFPRLPVVLCGGCFYNRVLTELVFERLAGRSEPVGTPGTIPVGDGGLAAGQLAIAAARLEKE